MNVDDVFGWVKDLIAVEEEFYVPTDEQRAFDDLAARIQFDQLVFGTAILSPDEWRTLARGRP